MKLILLFILIWAQSCAKKSDKSFSQDPTRNTVEERLSYSATVLAHVEIRQGEIEFLENAFNEDRSPMGSCFVEIRSGQIQKFKLFENRLEISSGGSTLSYNRASGRAFSIFGKWVHSQDAREATITSSLLIKEDKTIELTNACVLNRAWN